MDGKVCITMMEVILVEDGSDGKVEFWMQSCDSQRHWLHSDRNFVELAVGIAIG